MAMGLINSTFCDKSGDEKQLNIFDVKCSANFIARLQLLGAFIMLYHTIWCLSTNSILNYVNQTARI